MGSFARPATCAMTLLPLPGDLLICRRELKSRKLTPENVNNEFVKAGTIGLVMHVRTVGMRVWFMLLVDGRWLLFSSKAHTVHLNWERWSPPSPA